MEASWLQLWGCDCPQANRKIAFGIVIITSWSVI